MAKKRMKQVPLFDGIGEERMCVAYLRVSSRSQTHATQRSAIERAASARGDEIGHWFAESASGAKLARPELDRVRELARGGKVSKLYVYRLDRLTRSGIRDTLIVLEELQQHGCQVITVGDGFDLGGGASGQVVVAVMAWAASMERLAIGERIASARTRVEKAGGRWGRPARVDAETVGRIDALRAQGKTIRAIAMLVRVPKSTVEVVLSKKGAYLPPSKKRSNAGKRLRVRSVSE